MNRFKKMWSAALLLCALAVSSCGLLDTPEYPDGDFTIVGTWEYHVPALEGSSPNEGQVYNAEGQITFTTDKRFCFTLSTDRGEVKGYGTYRVDEDSGVFLTYSGYDEASQPVLGNCVGCLEDIHSIGWGWGEALTDDRVEDDYLKTHTDIEEYFRVETQPYEEVLAPYPAADGTAYYYVEHNGKVLFALPEPYAPAE